VSDAGDEFDERVANTSDGVVITAKLKRETATRDQDTIKGKVKRPTVEEALADVDALKEGLRELATDCREIQPEAEE